MFDLRSLQAKAQIDDALGVSQRIQPAQAPPPNQQPAVRPHAAPSMYQIPAGVPNPGALFGAPPPGIPQQQPMAGRLAGGQVGLNGATNTGAAMGNAMRLQSMLARYKPQGLGVRKQFQEGGLASSLRTDPVYHDRDVDFLDTENRHMREMVGKHAAHGGFSVKKR